MFELVNVVFLTRTRNQMHLHEVNAKLEGTCSIIFFPKAGCMGSSKRAGRAAAPCEKSGPLRPPNAAPSKVNDAGILLKLDANAPVCAASKTVF